VLAGGGDVAADRVPVPGGGLGAEPPGDLLLGFRWPQIPLGVVGSWRDPQVIQEPQDVVVAVAEVFQQRPVLELPAALAAGQFGQPGEHAVPEGVDERSGDVLRYGGQALVAGQVRLVDQLAQRVSSTAHTQ
jgi:hypothetical protein